MDDKLVNRPPDGDPSGVTAQPEPMPEKYANKSAAEIAEMHLAAEKKLGEQALEIGMLRRTQEATVLQPKPEPMPELDPDNPQAYIDHMLESKLAQALKPIAGTILEQQQTQFEAKLTQKHSDWQEVAGTEEFSNWIMESPVRQQIYQMADTGLDVEAASELLSTYKATQGLDVNATKAVEKAVKREKKIRATASERGSTGNQTIAGKTIKREDVIALRQRNPDEYRRRQTEIVQAYREGRVV